MSKNNKIEEKHAVLKEIAEHRDTAKQRLTEAKALEEERLKKGFRWVNKGDSTVFVSPKRLDIYLYKGYRITK